MADEEQIIRGSVRFTQQDVLRGIIAANAAYRARYLFAVWVLLTLLISRSSFEPSFAALLPNLILIAAVLGALFVAPWMRARATVRGQRLRESDVEFRFDEDGMTTRLPGGTATVAYRSLHGFRERPTFFLVYTAPGVSSVVPKRAFRPEDQGRVRELFAANVKRRRAFPLGLSIVLAFFVVFLCVVVWQFTHTVRPN